MKPKLPKQPVFFLLGTVLLSLGLTIPSHQLLGQVTRLQTEVNQLNSDLTKLQDSAFLVANFDPSFSDWQRSLPRTEEDVAVFAARLEELSREFDLEIEINFDDFPRLTTVDKLSLTSLGTTLTLTGRYQNLTSFLSNLSRLPYFYQINKLTILEGDPSGIKATLTGALFMYESP